MKDSQQSLPEIRWDKGLVKTCIFMIYFTFNKCVIVIDVERLDDNMPSHLSGIFLNMSRHYIYSQLNIMASDR